MCKSFFWMSVAMEQGSYGVRAFGVGNLIKCDYLIYGLPRWYSFILCRDQDGNGGTKWADRLHLERKLHLNIKKAAFTFLDRKQIANRH